MKKDGSSGWVLGTPTHKWSCLLCSLGCEMWHAVTVTTQSPSPLTVLYYKHSTFSIAERKEREETLGGVRAMPRNAERQVGIKFGIGCHISYSHHRDRNRLSKPSRKTRRETKIEREVGVIGRAVGGKDLCACLRGEERRSGDLIFLWLSPPFLWRERVPLFSFCSEPIFAWRNRCVVVLQ